MIVGESGGGKSNACRMIIDSLCRSGAHIAVLDPHDEYIGMSGGISAKVYDASRTGINIFEGDGMSEKERANEVTGMLRRNFHLGDVQSYTLYRCIMYTYRIMADRGRTPSIHDLIYSVKIFRKNARTASEKGTLDSLERRLSLIDSGAFVKSADMSSVVSQNSVFLLSGLHTNEAQSIYMEGFLRRIYSSMLSRGVAGRKGMFYVVIDEAQKLGENPILGRIAAEGRKYGIGIVAISQRAKPVDKDLRSNASMLMSFRMREPEELNYVANFIAGGNEHGRFMQVKKYLRNLGVGYAMVSGSRFRNPIVVRLQRYSKDAVSTDFLALKAARGGIREDRMYASLLKSGVQDPESAIGELLNSGELRRCAVKAGRYSGVWYISDNHNSPEHDVSVGIISDFLSAKGIRNSIYNSSYGPDISALCNGKRIAIEYETGSKDIDSTAEMISKRSGKYAGCVVFVNDAFYGAYSERMKNVFRISELESPAAAEAIAACGNAA